MTDETEPAQPCEPVTDEEAVAGSFVPDPWDESGEMFTDVDDDDG